MSFTLSFANMDDPTGLKIKNNGYILTFLAKINLVNGYMADVFKGEVSVFST